MSQAGEIPPPPMHIHVHEHERWRQQGPHGPPGTSNFAAPESLTQGPRMGWDHLRGPSSGCRQTFYHVHPRQQKTHPWLAASSYVLVDASAYYRNQRYPLEDISPLFHSLKPIAGCPTKCGAQVRSNVTSTSPANLGEPKTIDSLNSS